MSFRHDKKAESQAFTPVGEGREDVIDIDLSVDDEAPAVRAGYRQPRNLKKKKLIIAAIAAGAALLIAAGVFIGLKLFGSDPYDHTAEFYFSSDLLSEKGGEFTQSGGIEFKLCNYEDSLRTSIYDIESFDIRIMSKDSDITSKLSIKKTASSIKGGKRGIVSVSVSVPEEYYGKALDVSVTSRPTEIILHGTFTVVPSWTYSLTSEKDSVVATLLLSTDRAGVFTVKWDSDTVAADNTDENVALGDKESCEVVFEEAGSCEMHFFKIDTSESYSGKGKDLPVKVSFRSGGEAE